MIHIYISTCWSCFRSNTNRIPDVSGVPPPPASRMDPTERCAQEGPRRPEMHLSREEVVALEAADVRRRADRLVREAIDSGDWWQLNAAMQLVVSSGLGQAKVSPQGGRPFPADLQTRSIRAADLR